MNHLDSRAGDLHISNTSRGRSVAVRHVRNSIAALLCLICLIPPGQLYAHEAFNHQRGYEGPLRFESEGAKLLWRPQQSAPLQEISPGYAVFEVGVGNAGKLAYRLGFWLINDVPNPVEGTVTIAGDGLRGFNFPFRFDQTIVAGKPADGLFWTPWTQCVRGGKEGDICRGLDLESSKATSGSHITWAHLNRVAGVTGKAIFGPDDTFTIQLMPLDDFGELKTSTKFPWPPEER